RAVRIGRAPPVTVMATHETSVRVRWSDADPAGIAFYSRFFEWYDLGTEALFAALGMEWPALFPAHGTVGVPIVECGSTFVAPVRYGDVVTIRSTVAWVKDRTFRMEHEIRVGGALCARGFEVRAWVVRPDRPGDPLRARPIPGDVARRLEESA
ncbi:MAG: acyl-CoA thioesterase, partial [Candidatus Rokuibacteriota bacterium]